MLLIDPGIKLSCYLVQLCMWILIKIAGMSFSKDFSAEPTCWNKCYFVKHLVWDSMWILTVTQSLCPRAQSLKDRWDNAIKELICPEQWCVCQRCCHGPLCWCRLIWRLSDRRLESMKRCSHYVVANPVQRRQKSAGSKSYLDTRMNGSINWNVQPGTDLPDILIKP